MTLIPQPVASWTERSSSVSVAHRGNGSTGGAR